VVPNVAAAATPPRNASEARTGLGCDRKTIAVMIWGPAIIVTASGRIWSSIRRRLLSAGDDRPGLAAAPLKVDDPEA
jgi:hypothetical protein